MPTTETVDHAADMIEPLFRAELGRALASDSAGNPLMSDFLQTLEEKHGAIGGSVVDDGLDFGCQRAGGDFETVHASWRELRTGWDAWLGAELQRREVVARILAVISTSDLRAELARRTAAY